MGSLYFKKKDRIIEMVKSRLKENLHNYRIEVLRVLACTELFNTENGNRLWQDAHNKDIFNVYVAFEILENGKYTLLGWTKTSIHLIWNLNMDFTRNARWVKDGHHTLNPEHSDYTGVVA